jgi:predicted DNA-binding transcriptional regulator AlpA
MTNRLSRIIREKYVDAYCGLKRTQRAELIARGDFPAPIALSTRAKGYLETELIAWQQARCAERDAFSRAQEIRQQKK